MFKNILKPTSTLTLYIHILKNLLVNMILSVSELKTFYSYTKTYICSFWALIVTFYNVVTSSEMH